MKPVTRYILPGCFFLCAASFVSAQQAPPAVASTSTKVSTGSVNEVAPAAVTIGTNRSYGSGYSYSYSDDGRQTKEADLKSKEVSKEISVPKGADVYIENTSRNIVVKTWDQPKVKVTTTVYFEGESKLTDEEWLEKANLSLKTLGSSVKIKSGSYNNNGAYISSGTLGEIREYGSSGGGRLTFVNGSNKSSVKRIVIITIPAGSKVDVESKYSDVTLPSNIGDVNADMTNGNLEAENLDKFILRSKYANINVGDVKNAEVEMTNGRFSAKNIGDLDIESKYSTIEMAAAKKLMIRSTNDEYELEEAGDVHGRKAYGNLRITKLNGSMDVEGINADIKVRNVGPSLSLIKIDDKYADVRIPLRETKNYFVDFTGAYSSVYGNFEKKPVEEKVKEEKSSSAAPTPSSNLFFADGQGPALARSFSGNSRWNDTPSKFTATVGDGKGLKIEMKCQNCTVDFK